MRWASSRIGYRASIVSTFHSHAFTRAHASALIGREGVVVAVLRNGTTALVKLDDDPDELPGRVQCWPLRWDDLDLEEPAAMERPPDYVTGWSKSHGAIVFHAVQPRTAMGVCFSPAEPLPVCGWSVPFSPKMSRACPVCLRHFGL